MLLARDSLQMLGTQTESENMKKIFHENENQMNFSSIISANKTDLKTKTIIRGKVGYYIMIKKSTKKKI